MRAEATRPDNVLGAEHPRVSFIDEADLRAYFGSYRPGAPGERSNFGSMCARKASGPNPRTKELPTPGTPWTEILECGGGGGAANFDGEDAMLAYIDARWRFRRVSAALSRLSAFDQAVLDAYYGSEATEHPVGRLAGVAALTEAAQKRNRARAARGLHEPIEATVRWLAAATGGDARAAVQEVRRQADAMFNEARTNYGRARAAARSGAGWA